jgi:uncharacterized protein with HEPN domain
LRRDELYVADIIEAADAIARFIQGIGQASFAANDLVRSAVLQKLTVIGEAAAHVSEDLRNRNPEVPWPQVVAFRNIAVHAYFRVDWSIVWTTATQDVPELRKLLASIVQIDDAGAKP